MHAGAVRVDGEKMSKSLGNFFTIRDILAQYDAEVVRFLLISSHYRSAIDYSQESLKEARAGLDRLYTALRDHAGVAAASPELLATSAFHDRFVAAMDDDFNTREALAVMFELARAINVAKDAAEAQRHAAELKALGNVLGILQSDPVAYLQGGGDVDAARIEALIAERLAARKAKDFARSDQIRDELKGQGIVLEDGPGGTTWRRE
jgi:cysteinyl-tRNA synthetase